MRGDAATRQSDLATGRGTEAATGSRSGQHGGCPEGDVARRTGGAEPHAPRGTAGGDLRARAAATGTPVAAAASSQPASNRSASSAASYLLATPSLRRMFDTCTLAVFPLMKSAWAISLLVRPAAR